MHERDKREKRHNECNRLDTSDICRRYPCTILIIYSDPLSVVCVAVMSSGRGGRDAGAGTRGREWGRVN